MSFVQPDTLDAALRAMNAPGPQIIAGGTDVFPAARQGHSATTFVDVTRIAGLRDITRGMGETRIGAACTWTDVSRADLPPAFDALKSAARAVGGVQIQNAGTVAGNICNASPAADGVPPLLALDASVEMASAARGTRRLALHDFIKDVRRTSLAGDEIVTGIIVPDHPDGTASAFEKLGSRKYLVISICMTAANILLGPDRRIQDARVAVGACSPVARRLPLLEADLIGKTPGELRVCTSHLSCLSPIDDVRGSGAYRLDAVREQITRAILRGCGA